MRTFLYCAALLCVLSSCSPFNDDAKKDGISLNQATEDGAQPEEGQGASKDLGTRPGNVLQTGHPDHRLVPVYKVHYDARLGKTYTGENHYHQSYSNDYEDEESPWHQHFMPGLEAVYGFDLLNISHYNSKTKQRNNLFANPVLVNTLYFPSYIQDSLNLKPIVRHYYLASAYDEDTNRDSLINRLDLRRFYHFNLEGTAKAALIPNNYSVLSSEYDPMNDAMFVFAKLDENANGQQEDEEPVHVFLIDLKSLAVERMY